MASLDRTGCYSTTGDIYTQLNRRASAEIVHKQAGNGDRSERDNKAADDKCDSKSQRLRRP